MASRKPVKLSSPTRYWDASKLKVHPYIFTSVFALLGGVFLLSSFAGKPKDSTPPSVQIIYPASGITVNGITTITVKSTDNTSVKSMSVYVDGNLEAQIKADLLAHSWDTSSLAPGQHTITVKAYDTSGNLGEASVTVAK